MDESLFIWSLWDAFMILWISVIIYAIWFWWKNRK